MLRFHFRGLTFPLGLMNLGGPEILFSFYGDKHKFSLEYTTSIPGLGNLPEENFQNSKHFLGDKMTKQARKRGQ